MHSLLIHIFGWLEGKADFSLQAFWVARILYSITTMLTKTSIVFVYMRIFPDPKFHRVAWIVVVSVSYSIFVDVKFHFMKAVEAAFPKY